MIQFSTMTFFFTVIEGVNDIQINQLKNWVKTILYSWVNTVYTIDKENLFRKMTSLKKKTVGSSLKSGTY